MLPGLLTHSQVARILGYTTADLHYLVSCGHPPSPCMETFSGFQYRPATIREFLQEHHGEPPDAPFLSEGMESSYALDDTGIWRRKFPRELARQLGARRYFTGEPCTERHVAHRYTKDDQCVICVASAARRRQ